MGRVGKISTIKKNYSRDSGSLESSLAMNGFTRFPGTGVRFVPYKESNGDYRTGLNSKALYLNKLPKEVKALAFSLFFETYESTI